MRNIHLCLIVSSIVLFYPSLSDGGSTTSADDMSQESRNVPFVAVLSNPKAFDGKKVRTSGVISLGFESNYFYLDAESYSHFALINAALITSHDTRSEEITGKYVTIEAVFEFDPELQATMGLVGRLSNVRVKTLARRD